MKNKVKIIYLAFFLLAGLYSCEQNVYFEPYVAPAPVINYFTLGGQVNGLNSGDNVVLQLTTNTSVSNLIVTAGATSPAVFTFNESFVSGNGYLVTVVSSTAPSVCLVTNATGVFIDVSISTVTVNCNYITNYSVGGNIAGLAPGNQFSITESIGGSSINNTANGLYNFMLPGSFNFAVSAVSGTGPIQECNFVQPMLATGTVSGANILNIDVQCLNIDLSFDMAAAPALGSVLENGSLFNIVALLSVPATTSITLNYNINAGSSATSGTDYSIGSSITIPAGSLSVNIPVTIIDDLVFEGNETIQVSISSAVGANVVGTTLYTLTITDDDPIPVINFDLASSATIDEGTFQTVTVSLTNAASTAVTVDVVDATTGTATSATDYNAVVLTTLTFPAGTVGPQSVIITPIQDTIYEGNQTVVLNLQTPSANGVLGVSAHTLTITDDDPIPVINFDLASSATIDEGTAKTVTVSLANAASTAVTVDVVDATTGTATSATDYTAVVLTTLTFPAGIVGPQSVTITPIQDTIYEGNETVVLNLQTPSANGVLGVSGHTLTITDDDPIPVINFDLASSATIDEGTFQTVTVSLTNAASTAVTVDVVDSTTGTATSATDYNAVVLTTLTFPAGTVGPQSVVITPIQDTIYEGNETVVLNLQTPSANGVLGVSAHTLTITDDDPIPVINFDLASSATIDEGTFQTVTVSLANAASTAVTVDVVDATTGTATSATDYNAVVLTTLTFPAGTTGPQSVVITPIQDTIYEGNETVVLNLQTPSANGVLGVSAHTLTITDDDPIPVVTLTGGALVNENVLSHNLTIQVSPVSYEPITVSFGAPTGTAVAGNDYNILSVSPVIIPALTATISISMDILDDTIYEGATPESIVVALSGATSGSTNVVLGAPGVITQTVTITDNETVPVVTLSGGGVSVIEASGTTAITLTLSHQSEAATTVTLSLAGTAAIDAVNSDFSTVPAYTLAPDQAVVTIPALTGSGILTINSTDDVATPVQEGDETVAVDLVTVVSYGNNGSITSQPQTVTILDDDIKGPSVIVDGTLVDGVNRNAAEYYDTNGNGKIDHLLLTFDEPVDETTFDGYNAGAPIVVSNWLISGYANVKLDNSTLLIPATAINNGAGDRYIWLTFTEGAVFDTGSKPDLTMSNSTLKDISGFTCFVNALTTSACITPSSVIGTLDIAEKDKANPKIVSISNATIGILNNNVILVYSEAITALSTGGSCSLSSLLTGSSFVYNNTSGSFVDGLSISIADWPDTVMCDRSRVGVTTAGVDSTLNVADMGSDSIQVLPSQIYDANLNVMTDLTAYVINNSPANVCGDGICNGSELPGICALDCSGVLSSFSMTPAPPSTIDASISAAASIAVTANIQFGSIQMTLFDGTNDQVVSLTEAPIGSGNYSASYVPAIYGPNGAFRFKNMYLYNANNTLTYFRNSNVAIANSVIEKSLDMTAFAATVLNSPEISVINQLADITPPVLNSISTSGTPTGSGGTRYLTGDILTVNMNVTDDISGVASIRASLYDPVLNYFGSCVVAAPVSGANSCNITISGAAPFTENLEVDFITLKDVAGNQRVYSYNAGANYFDSFLAAASAVPVSFVPYDAAAVSGTLVVNNPYTGWSVAGEIWLAVPVTSGLQYTVYWDDALAGSGSKTADVVVSAFTDLNVNLFNQINSGYVTGQSFIAGYTGFVYVSVSVPLWGFPGTFGIAVTSP